MANQSTIHNSNLSIVTHADVTAPTFIPRYTVRLVPGSRPASPLVLVHDSISAATALRPFFAGLDREQFLVCCLDAKHAIIGVNVVSIGSLTLSIVHPREVFKPAILLNTSALICAHNHPSGDPEPSSEDRALTPVSARLATCSASPCLITLFWATIVPTASQIAAGRREARPLCPVWWVALPCQAVACRAPAPERTVRASKLSRPLLVLVRLRVSGRHVPVTSRCPALALQF